MESTRKKKSVRALQNAGVFWLSKARVSCQDGTSLRRVEECRSVFQTVPFQGLKNAIPMADVQSSGVS